MAAPPHSVAKFLTKYPFHLKSTSQIVMQMIYGKFKLAYQKTNSLFDFMQIIIYIFTRLSNYLGYVKQIERLLLTEITY